MIDPYSPPSLSASQDATVSPRWHASIYLQAFQLMVRFPLLLAACYLVVWVPLDLVVNYIDTFFIPADSIRLSFQLQNLASLLFGVISAGAITSAAQLALNSETPTVGGSLVVGLKNWLRVCTCRLWYSIVVGIGLVVFVIPGIYIAVRGIYCETIGVTERVYGPRAFSRSFKLTRNRFGQHLAMSLAMLGIGLVCAVPYILISFAGEQYLLMSENDSWWDYFWIFDALASEILGFAYVYTYVLAYCGYRQRTEQMATPQQAHGLPADHFDHLQEAVSE